MTRDADPPAESGPQPEGGSSEATPAPLLRVISPNATPEEIAALVTVLAALGGGEPAPKRRTPPEWQSPSPHRPPDAPPRARRLALERPAALTTARRRSRRSQWSRGSSRRDSFTAWAVKLMLLS